MEKKWKKYMTPKGYPMKTNAPDTGRKDQDSFWQSGSEKEIQEQLDAIEMVELMFEYKLISKETIAKKKEQLMKAMQKMKSKGHERNNPAYWSMYKAPNENPKRPAKATSTMKP